MNWKAIVVLILILLGLGVGIFIVNKQEAEKKEKEGKLFTLDSAKVVKIEVIRSGDRFLFSKKGSAWEIAEPIQVKADKIVVENIVDNFSSLKYDRTAEKEARDLNPFGLHDPRIKLNLYKEKQTQPSYSILVGFKNDMDQSSYVKLSTGSQVVMVAGYKIGYLEKTLFDYREKKFVGVDSADIASFSYTQEGNTFAFRKKDDSWIMEKPVFSLADDIKVNDILTRATLMEAKAFLEKQPPAEKMVEYGFHTPLAELAFSLKDNTTKALKVVKKEDKYFAYSPEFGEICEVNQDLVDKLDKDPKNLRNSKIAPFYPYEVRELNFSSPQVEFSIKKNQDMVWEWIKPDHKVKLNQERVNNLLTALEGMSATEYIDQPAKDTAFPYTIRMKLGTTSKSELRSLDIQLSDVVQEAVIARNSSLPYQIKTAKIIIEKLPQKIDEMTKSGLPEKFNAE